MKWKISWLKSLPSQKFEVDETLTFDSKMFQKVSNIDDISDVNVKGEISIKDELVYIDLNFSGIMYLPCANTGEIGEYPFSFNVNELLDDEFDDSINYEADFINLLELTWQRLIVEAPTRYVKADISSRSGKSWQILSEEDYAKKEEDYVDPRLAKLKDLFKDDKEG